jgi:hypothetical protein
MRRDQDRLSHQWGIGDRRGDTLLDDLQIFLGDLCKGGGFCNALADDVLTGDEALTADAFATAVLAAEGWADPEHEYRWRPQIAKLFIERYGPSISATDYEGSSSS